VGSYHFGDNAEMHELLSDIWNALYRDYKNPQSRNVSHMGSNVNTAGTCVQFCSMCCVYDIDHWIVGMIGIVSCCHSICKFVVF